MPVVTTRDTRQEITSTIGLLKHLRAFVRSDCELVKDPWDDFSGTLTKEQTQRKLTWLVDVAINRRAGIQDRRAEMTYLELQDCLKLACKVKRYHYAISHDYRNCNEDSVYVPIGGKVGRIMRQLLKGV